MEDKSDKNKKSGSGCLKIFMWTVAILIIIVGIPFLINYSKHLAYDAKKVFAFELTEFDQGANHYGEREYYKFFSDGTGMYLFESWHDSSDCDDPHCHLKSETRTSTFNYHVIDHNCIVLDKKTSSSDKPTRIIIDPDSEQIIVDSDAHLLSMKEETVNWDEIKKMLEL